MRGGEIHGCLQCLIGGINPAAKKIMSRTHIPGKTVDVRYYNTTLHLYLDMGVGIGGDKWPAAEKFCHLLAYNGKHAFFGELFNSKTCLELGSGNGIVGILLDKLYQPKQVVITDLESHVEHIRKNLVLNSAETHCSAEALDWKCFSLPFQQFDFIFALEWLLHAFLPFVCTLILISTFIIVCIGRICMCL